MFNFGDIHWRIKFEKEQLRNECSDQLGRLAPDERELLSVVNSSQLSAAEIFIKFCEHTKTALEHIESADSADRIQKGLKKIVKLNATDIEQSLGNLLLTLRGEILRQFYSEINVVNNRDLTRMGAAKIEDLIIRFCNYRRAIEIADEYGLILYDKFAPKYIQRRQKRQIRRERKSDAEHILAEHHRIEHRIAKLLKHNELLAKIYKYDLDPMMILGLKQDYQRKLDKRDKLTTFQQKDAFDSVTSKYIKETIEAKSSLKPQSGINELREIERQILDTIGQAFELDNLDRNNLVRDVSKYRKLSEQKTDLELILNNQAKISQ